MRDVCEGAVFPARDPHNRAHALSRLTGTLGCGPRPGPPRTPRRTPAPGAHPSPCPGRSRTSSPARRWPPTCPRRPPAGAIVTYLRTTMGPGRCRNVGGSQSAPITSAAASHPPARWPRRSPAPRCRTAAIGRGRRRRPRLQPPPPRAFLSSFDTVIEAPWLVNGGHGASLRHHNGRLGGFCTPLAADRAPHPAAQPRCSAPPAPPPPLKVLVRVRLEIIGSIIRRTG